MRVLVLGAHGLVGAHVAAAAKDAVVVSRTLPDGTPFDFAAPGAPAMLARLVRERGLGAVIVAAARPGVEGCERDPDGSRVVNVDAPVALARALGDAATVVVFSTEYVFDGTAGPYREEAATRPLNVYGAQKLELEGGVLAAGPHLVLRTSAVYGAEPARKNFVLQLVDAARAGRALPVPDDQVVTPTCAGDLATVALRAVAEGATGILHAAGPEVMGRVAFAELVAHILGLPRSAIAPQKTSALGLQAARPVSAGLDTTRIQARWPGILRPPADALLELMPSEVTCR